MATFTAEQKAEAVRLYLEIGPDEAAEQVGCSRRAIYTWLGMHGVQPKKEDEQRQDTIDRHAAKRETLRELLMDQAIEVLHRMNEPHIQWETQYGEQVEILHMKAEAGDCRNYATSAGILIDKYRLEMGEATSRTVTEGSDDIDRSVAQLVAELARRGTAKAS